MKKIIEKDIEVENYKIYLRLFELYKSYLLLVSDNQHFGIGNVTIATPIQIDNAQKSFKSYKLFGIQQDLLNQIIAEKFCSYLNAPVLLLLFFTQIKDENAILNSFMKTLVELLKEIKNS